MLLNGQNPLSMTKVICRQPLTTILFNRYYLQNCKAILFRKIVIIPNRNKVCSKSSSNFLIEFGYCGASSIPSALDETDFQKILTGVLSEGQGHVQKCVDSMHFLKMRTSLRNFPPHVRIRKSEKIQEAFWRDKTLRSLKKYERMHH